MGSTVVVRLYATAREAAGTDRIEIPVPPSGLTIGALAKALTAAAPPLARLLPQCRFARNGTYATRSSARVRPGDDVAVHPPYSGG